LHIRTPTPTPASGLLAGALTLTPTPTPTPTPTAPHVTGIVAAGSSSKRATTLAVTFDEALNAVATSNTSLFQVLGGVKKHGKNGLTKGVAIKSTTYNPTTHTVTLNLARRSSGPVQVTVHGGVPSAAGVPSRGDVTAVVV
jgi:hypothetical protein